MPYASKNTGVVAPPIVMWRLYWVAAALSMALLLVVGRLLMVQLQHKPFLLQQSELRTQRVDQINAQRGVIMDRQGEVLAVSTPLVSLWADPRELHESQLPRLAQLAGVSLERLRQRYRVHDAFMYIRRHMAPAQAEPILQLAIKGVYARYENRRYYPGGETVSHVVGVTDIDDQGQEGLELVMNEQLQAHPGRKRVIKDLKGQVVRDVELLQAAQPGQSLQLTLDMRLQYLAYAQLQQAVVAHQAESGSAVIVDVRSGDILAIANYPSYNPNHRATLTSSGPRNRAVTDMIEPGSVIKPFIMAAAMEMGTYGAYAQIDTSPGYTRVSGKTIRDHRNYGVLDMQGILAKSSNVGISKIALSLPGEELWRWLYAFGFGQTTGIGLPGEGAGKLPNPAKWQPLQQATLSFGYGLSATPLQLAQAYTILANDGIKRPLRLLQGAPVESPYRVMSAKNAQRIRQMLAAVVEPGGTGHAAALAEYAVAGKTGTVHKAGRSGYLDDRYQASFVGMAPVQDPRLVIAVVINDPRQAQYYGGEVAAPVFARLMQQALPLLHVLPQQLKPAQLAQQGAQLHGDG